MQQQRQQGTPWSVSLHQQQKAPTACRMCSSLATKKEPVVMTVGSKTSCAKSQPGASLFQAGNSGVPGTKRMSAKRCQGAGSLAPPIYTQVLGRLLGHQSIIRALGTKNTPKYPEWSRKTACSGLGRGFATGSLNQQREWRPAAAGPGWRPGIHLNASLQTDCHWYMEQLRCLACRTDPRALKAHEVSGPGTVSVQ